MLQLRFQRLTLRDVHHDAFHHRVGIAALHNHCRVAQPHFAPVFSPDPEFRLEGKSIPALFFRCDYDWQVVRVNLLIPIRRKSQPLVRRVTQNVFHLRADVKPFPVDPDFRDVGDRIHMLNQHAVLGFCVRPRLFRLLVLRQIAPHAHGAAVRQAPRLKLHRNAAAVGPPQLQIAGPLAHLPQPLANLRF